MRFRGFSRRQHNGYFFVGFFDNRGQQPGFYNLCLTSQLKPLERFVRFFNNNRELGRKAGTRLRPASSSVVDACRSGRTKKLWADDVRGQTTR